MSIKFECQSIIFTATELWFPEILGQYKLCVHIVLYLLYICDHLNSTILKCNVPFQSLICESHKTATHIVEKSEFILHSCSGGSNLYTTARNMNVLFR